MMQFGRNFSNYFGVQLFVKTRFVFVLFLFRLPATPGLVFGGSSEGLKTNVGVGSLSTFKVTSFQPSLVVFYTIDMNVVANHQLLGGTQISSERLDFLFLLGRGKVGF